MGGCCCSSRRPPFHGTPVYYYFPPSEEQESLTSHDGVATVLSSGLLIDLNLNMSIPDTYRSPPAPIPYDVVLGQPQSTGSEPCGSFEKPNFVGPNDENHHLLSPRKIDIGLVKLNTFNVAAENDEDCCPTCLEEYDAENPKIMTKCKHNFHLSCILEWMERSETCPICDQEMIYEIL
ncbi:RING-H2 finger B1A [Striga hermonthica]|uniref:RING-type E3 ubiquitin transferase n=1 Tax=Striga hermonthica TaxID=68872 RepID=A0A9N7R8W6_STRHE|nr:RING-H2 finger B1A [Striga hermonthica]